MRPNPLFDQPDEQFVRELIGDNPWATLVSHTDEGIVASHYPVLLDDAAEELAVLTHVGRPDDRLHAFGRHEMLVIIAGTHGYISPSWYPPPAAAVPTWNFTVAHCYGIPQVLDPQENLTVLARLVDHFERHVETPAVLDPQRDAALAAGTVGIRVPITRYICKVKMSQNKDAQTQRQVLEALRRPGPYENRELADQMQQALSARPTP
jgi:transcriptional regulator